MKTFQKKMIFVLLFGTLLLSAMFITAHAQGENEGNEYDKYIWVRKCIYNGTVTITECTEGGNSKCKICPQM